MVAEKFPPFNLSGSARPFYFAKYLPDFGYEPQVIASTLLVGEERDDALLGELPVSVRVQRTPRVLSPLVIRARNHLERRSSPAATQASNEPHESPRSGLRRSARGAFQYVGWWTHWELDWAALATLAGIWEARLEAPQLIWASGPHFRNFVVAARLAARLRRPLVVDLRDPWTYGSLWRPKTESIARAERAWAQRVLGSAERIVFTSPLTLEAMHRHFPELDRARLVTITNGFEDTEVEPLRGVSQDHCLFRYVGMLNERRQPDVLIRAFAEAARDPEFRERAVLEFIGNAGGHERKRELAPGCDIRFRGHVPRSESLGYIFGSDVNLLLQTISEGQDVISGKAFDYLHARRPIVAVVDPAGGDAWLLRQAGVGQVAAWNDSAGIVRALSAEFARWKAGAQASAAPDVSRYSRRGLTAELARLFDELLDA
jgi:glycosyltransferase involved in cell wall biosynthesis